MGASLRSLSTGCLQRGSTASRPEGSLLPWGSEVSGVFVAFLSREDSPALQPGVRTLGQEVRVSLEYRQSPLLLLTTEWGPRGWPGLCAFVVRRMKKARKGGGQTTTQSAGHHGRHTKMRLFMVPSFSPTAVGLPDLEATASQSEGQRKRQGRGPLSFEAMWVAAGRNRGPSFRDNGSGPMQRQTGERPRLRGLDAADSNPSFLCVLCSTQRCISLCETKFFIY